MSSSSETASKVPPFMVAAVICDVAATDPSSGKHSLIGTFFNLVVLRFPTERPMSLYVKLSDAIGYYPLRVDFVREGAPEVLARAEGEMKCNDKTGYVDFLINFPPLPFPEAGRYEFQIYASDMYVGNAFLDAVPRPANNQ